MKIAVYQAPLAATATAEMLELIGEQMQWCDAQGVSVLCCPEAVLGGLADYSPFPHSIAMSVEHGELEARLRPLRSCAVTAILGFTEADPSGQLYNSAAIIRAGELDGVYRKRHPAINRSVYEAGHRVPVFSTGGLTFGIMICRDSLFPETARVLASKGASIIFVPSNNGLPLDRRSESVVEDARATDASRARENGVYVARADVAGETATLRSYGSSGITGPDGILIDAPAATETGCVVVEIARRVVASMDPAVSSPV